MPGLTFLRFRNVKSWADTGEMHLAPITGLFGANSSGKSSILQMLLMLKQTAESSDRAQVLRLGGERALVDVGSFGDLAHEHRVTAPIGCAMAWSLPDRMSVRDPADPSTELFSTDHLHFEAEVVEIHRKNASQAVVQNFTYCLGASNKPCFGMKRVGNSADRYEVTASHFALRRFPGRPAHLPAPVKFYGFPDAVYAAYQNVGFVADLQLSLEEMLARVFYLGPLRDFPKRQYVWAGTQPTDVGGRGELAVAALLAARERNHMVSRGARKRQRRLDWVVADWLRRLGLIVDFSLRSVAAGSNLYRVLVRTATGAAEVPITDVGFGVSQVLPVLVLCYAVPKGSTIILEQPEIHLHPAVQAGLADVLVDAVKVRDVQIIVESHSEHLLRRLQRRIAEAALPASDAALYFCGARDGTSSLTRLELDDFGNIRNWPSGFFGDELGELSAMTSAAMQRRIATAS